MSANSEFLCSQKQLLNFRMPVLSFFTGAGFLDMGFEKAGFDIIWTNENNPAFIKLYESGYTAWRKSEGNIELAKISEERSIESLNTIEVKNQAFGNSIPSLWGVIGGPPCPDFSNGGKNKGVEGDKGRLTQIFIEFVIEMQAPFFLMENVSGLYRIKKHKVFLGELRSQLADNKYITDVVVLNALHYGAAQDRPRTFLIGFKKQLFEQVFPKKDFPPDTGWFSFPEGNYKDIKSIQWPKTNRFGADVELPKNIPLNLTVYPLLASDPSPEELPNGQEYFNPHSNKFYKIEEGNTSGKSFKRLHRFKYSPTACYGNNEVHLHPWKARRLSVREVLRIQGIPDTYILPEGGSLSDKFKYIGNGVPMALAFHVAQALKIFLIRR